MNFKRIYRCLRCGAVFPGCAVLDDSKSLRYDTNSKHEHACAAGEKGLADQIGIDEVKPQQE